MSRNALLVVCLFLVVLLQWEVQGYRLISGQRKLIPRLLDLVNAEGLNGPIIRSIPRMLVVPYQIYEYHQAKINTTSFIMLKTDYTDIFPLLTAKPPLNDLPSLEEQKALYTHLPEVVLIEGAENELLQLELLTESLESRQLVVKNSSGTWTDNGPRRYDLNFYALQTHKTLFKVISAAYLKLKDSKAKTEDQYSQEKEDEEPVNATERLASRRKEVLERILPNETLWQSQDFTHILLEKIHNETIFERTKWRALYDGFCLKYFSVTFTNGDDHLGQVELVSRVVREGENVVNRVISEPMRFLKFSSMDFVDVCIQRESWSVLLSDGRKGYLIDISKEEWNLVKYIKITQNNLRGIFFGMGCKVYGLHLETVQSKIGGGKVDKIVHHKVPNVLNDTHSIESKQGQNQTEQGNVWETSLQSNLTELQTKETTGESKLKNQTLTHIVQYFPKNQKRKSLRMQVDHYFSLNINYIVFCRKNNSCVIVQTDDSWPEKKMIQNDSNNVQLVFPEKEMLKFRTQVVNSTIQAFIEVFDRQSLVQQLLPISLQVLSSNNSFSYSSALTNTIYSLDTYSNKTKLISREMDRGIYQHLQLNNLIPANKHKLLYQQIFDNEHLQEKCIIVADVDSSQIEIRYNDTQEWLVCALEIETRQYLELRLLFQEKYLNYQLYLCSSYIQPYNYRMSIACGALLEPLADTQVAASFSMSHELNGNYFYKLYTVRQNEKMVRNLPGIFLKDIQREQIELASAVFFVIMIVLSLLLLGLVFFLALKSIFVNLLIYYGWVRQRQDPTYPLAWFPLKTKLKRLQQNGILSFIEYQPSIGDTEGNHCCFCLEIMRSKTQVAAIYCGHEFHKECFSEWIKNQPNSRCPTCRRPFTRTGLLEYQSGLGSHQELAPF